MKVFERDAGHCESQYKADCWDKDFASKKAFVTMKSQVVENVVDFPTKGRFMYKSLEYSHHSRPYHRISISKPNSQKNKTFTL